MGVGGVYAGAVEEGEKVLAPLRAYGPPIADLFQPTPYNIAQRMADFLWPSGLLAYWKSRYLKDLSDAAIAVITDFFARVPSKHTVVVLEYYGNSAIQRVPNSATAFGHRQWFYNIVVTSAWSDPAETARNVTWTRKLFEALSPFTANAAYVNYIGDEGADGLNAAYGAENLARLRTIKMRYDPTNLFRINQNIAPASAARKNDGNG